MLALRDEHGIDVSDLTIKKEKQVPEEKREEVRCLAKWMGCQRSARQKGDLEAYQEHLLSQELGCNLGRKEGAWSREVGAGIPETGQVQGGSRPL